MPRITKLKAQKNNKRVNLYLDGKYLLSLDLVTVTKQGLKVGMLLTSGELEALSKKHRIEKLFNRALHFLSFRPRSEKEVRTFLSRRFKGEMSKARHRKLIEKIIAKLKAKKLIDDAEFSKWWVQQRANFRPKGTILLRQELIQKGVKREAIDEALGKVDDSESAKKLAETKLRSLKNLESQKAKQVLTGFLLRRGFSWEAIKRAVDETLNHE